MAPLYLCALGWLHLGPYLLVSIVRACPEEEKERKIAQVRCKAGVREREAFFFFIRSWRSRLKLKKKNTAAQATHSPNLGSIAVQVTVRFSMTKSGLITGQGAQLRRRRTVGARGRYGRPRVHKQSTKYEFV